MNAAHPIVYFCFVRHTPLCISVYAAHNAMHFYECRTHRCYFLCLRNTTLCISFHVARIVVHFGVYGTHRCTFLFMLNTHRNASVCLWHVPMIRCLMRHTALCISLYAAHSRAFLCRRHSVVRFGICGTHRCAFLCMWHIPL